MSCWVIGQGEWNVENSPGTLLSAECRRCQLAAAMELEPVLMFKERLRLEREMAFSLSAGVVLKLSELVVADTAGPESHCSIGTRPQKNARLPQSYWSWERNQ